MSARERLADMVRTDRGDMNVYSQPEVRAALDAYRGEVQAEILGTDLNPSRLVLNAQAYRQLADDVLATMPDPDRWDLDADEGSICAQYVKHLAAQVALAAEFRVPLPERLGEVVVERESADSDRWAVISSTRLRAWIDGDGWKYVTDIGRAAAFVYGLDEALDMAEEVARIEGEQYNARIAARIAEMREAGEQQ
jgi:hypothetical protein